jgi:hypothetical protein
VLSLAHNPEAELLKSLQDTPLRRVNREFGHSVSTAVSVK